MRSFLGLLHGRSRARIQILPDADFVILNGHNEEARGQYLRGKVTLSIAAGAIVRGIELRLTKVTRNGHHSDVSEHENKELIHQWLPFLVKGTPQRSNIYSSTYEWPFEIFVPGTQTESFKGCNLCCLSYRLEASTIDGCSAGPEHSTFTPIRITRCPASSCYELLDSVASHGKFGANVEYSMASRHQAIALGGLIPIDVRLAMLEPGVRLSDAKFHLREIHSAHKPATGTNTAVYMERTVEQWPLDIDTENQNLHTWQQCLHLPRIVGKCSPDISVHGISISHTLHFSGILTEDGADREFDTSIPVTLFVSPEFPISGWDIFSFGYDEMTKERSKALASGIGVPPQYSESSDDDSIDLHSLAGTQPPPYVP